jgi:glycerol transport system ATP-binding protein
MQNDGRRQSVQALQLRRVSRVVDGEPYLSDIQLELEPGSFNVLLGRTRAGKTTLLRTLAGLDRPDSGQLYWGARDVTRVSVQQRDVAMVYQQFVNYPSLTVYDNIASPLRVRGCSRAEIERRVRETASRLGLLPLLQRLPAELSGGQQQRTAIARALVKDATLVLLDEPLANLDYKLREELRAELRAIFDAQGATVVYATTEPDEALRLGGRTLVLDEGRVLQAGPALAVYKRPVNQRVAQVFSDPELNVLDMEIDETSVRIAHEEQQPGVRIAHEQQSSLRLAPGRYRIGIRANHLHLQPATPNDLCFAGTALVDEVTGSVTLLHVAYGALTLIAQLPGIQRHALGSPVRLFVSPEQLLVFDSDGLSHYESAHGTH